MNRRGFVGRAVAFIGGLLGLQSVVAAEQRKLTALIKVPNELLGFAQPVSFPGDENGPFSDGILKNDPKWVDDILSTPPACVSFPGDENGPFSDGVPVRKVPFEQLLLQADALSSIPDNDTIMMTVKGCAEYSRTWENLDELAAIIQTVARNSYLPPWFTICENRLNIDGGKDGRRLLVSWSVTGKTKSLSWLNELGPRIV